MSNAKQTTGAASGSAEETKQDKAIIKVEDECRSILKRCRQLMAQQKFSEAYFLADEVIIKAYENKLPGLKREGQLVQADCRQESEDGAEKPLPRA
ncbi:hypothetical protein JDV02_002189 [Purpureocillium takamizusanense]|uniref:Uncharacterized protein n=1 Tax=Purpureocillium takamizusanense TaxID=2060973 RepID=A0A9Q8V7G6_9HYPO|nr:uncharacterized protein JDV02_002189 [Purpureocillium takamizusanense]UNI15678.1 hypothetical protein JDV02_002189 [Purpureocillium takamizusanense]